MPTVPADEDALTQAIIALASEYGRYGYRRVTALLQAAGWQVGKDRVQRIWRREGRSLGGTPVLWTGRERRVALPVPATYGKRRCFERPIIG